MESPELGDALDATCLQAVGSVVRVEVGRDPEYSDVVYQVLGDRLDDPGYDPTFVELVADLVGELRG